MQKKQRHIFFLIFTLSGFSGLIYESIWTHYLKLFLGHAAYAQTLVLAIFMGGMALGSWLCSYYSVRWKNLLLVYAAAEGVIGLFALIFHPVFDRTIQLSYFSIIPRLGSPETITVFKWVLSSLLILPQTVLLGMTFPLMTGGMLRLEPQDPGRTVSMLYFVNSIGAAIGVLASGFLLIRLFGLPGTIRAAGLINLVLAAVVWQLLSKQKTEAPIVAMEGRSASGNESRGWRWLLAASLLTGAASFIYEIAWIRMLNFVLGSSTHAFELMLSAFIFGLAFGGLWIRRRIDRMAEPVRFLVGVQVVMGILAIATLPLYGSTFRIMQWLVQHLDKTDQGYLLFTLASHGIALAIMLPATFCAGMTLPLITYSLLRLGHGERSIGAVYASNTIGGILGVFFAVHLGMPLLGLKNLMIFGGCLDIVLGLALFWNIAPRVDRKAPALATAGCVCVVVVSLLFVNLDPYKMASGVYREGTLMTPTGSDIVFYKDGKTATVSVVKLQLMEATLMNIRTNGKADAAINVSHSGGASFDESTMSLLGVLPLAMNPGAKIAANIGLGSGLTTQSLLGWPELERVDTVEIEPAMVEGARNFGDRVNRVFTDPRSRIYIDDAKTFFSSHRQKYDIIVSEPSNPWISGVAGLFSQEFYRLARNRLAPRGVFCQWVQLYESDMNLIASVLKAVSENFADYVLYMSNNGDLLILASDSPLKSPDPRVIGSPEIVHALQRISIETIQDLEIRRVGNRKVLGKFFESFHVPPNSDYYPFLDQNAERARFLSKDARQLMGLTIDPLPVRDMIEYTAPQQEKTNITTTTFFPPTNVASTAMSLRDHFLSGDPKKRPVDGAYVQHVLTVERLFGDCKARPDEDESIASLYMVASVMSAYLNPEELDAVWKRLEAKPCSRSLTRRQRNWVVFFKALGRRDPNAMEVTANNLLAQEQDIPQGASRLLVASAMLGSLAQGDQAGSLRLWQDYRSKLFGADGPNMIFRLLAAESGAR